MDTTLGPKTARGGSIDLSKNIALIPKGDWSGSLSYPYLSIRKGRAWFVGEERLMSMSEKESHFLPGEVFFVLTIPLMDDLYIFDLFDFSNTMLKKWHFHPSLHIVML